MADYGDVDELILGYLPKVSNDDDKTVLAAMLTRMSRVIDQRTRRRDNAYAPAPEEPTEKTFYGTGQAVLLVTEFVAASIEAVTGPADYLPPSYVEFRRAKIVGLHTATADKMLTPRVVWAKGVPFAVTARWGFAATPGPIVEATYRLVRDEWRQQSGGDVFGTSGDVNQFRQTERGFPKAVDALLEPFVLDETVEEEEEGTIERGDLFDADTNSRGGGWGRW